MQNPYRRCTIDIIDPVIGYRVCVISANMYNYVHVFSLQDCGIFNHPDREELLMQRIRSYSFQKTLAEQCQGSTIYGITTYLIIDNATSADAGTYEVTVTSGHLDPTSVKEIINVVVGMCQIYIIHVHVHVHVNVCLISISVYDT